MMTMKKNLMLIYLKSSWNFRDHRITIEQWVTTRVLPTKSNNRPRMFRMMEMKEMKMMMTMKKWWLT
jgi:hypothetical protein